MPKIHLDRSIIIKAKPGEIYVKLNDFNHWQAWSPWIITEPDAEVKVREDGKYYEWDGKIVGSGNMTILTERTSESIDYDLTFLKPWKSTAKVSFKLVPVNEEETRVHWTMNSSLPFFLFFMKKMMTAYVGMDYDRGLLMLKEYIEAGEVNSKMEFKGITNYDGCKFVGLKTTCEIDKMKEHMSADWEKLMTYFMQNHPEKMAGNQFSQYHKWDPIRNKAVYTAGVPVNSIPEDLPEETYVGSLPSTKVHTIKHTGPYHYSGNVWSAQYSRQRAKTFKVNKSIHPFEVYFNSPKDTEPNNLETEVHFPIKG